MPTPNVIDFAYKSRGLTHARLSGLLSYEGSSGLLRWLTRMGPRKSGSIAGHLNKSMGYVFVGIDGEIYLAHLLIWFLKTGQWPQVQIDHRDLDKSNNGWGNLREASHSQNCANRPKRCDSQQPYKGVRKKGRKWRAFVSKNGKRVSLGYFESAEDAAAAYSAAAKRLHGEFARAA